MFVAELSHVELCGCLIVLPKQDLFLNAYVVPALASKGYHMDVIDVPK